MEAHALTVSSGTEELRLAMGWNGGVSLAVWMGGAAVELDCARRAHLGPEDTGGGSERRVYNALCRAFDRILVLDIIAGASAGGINGALLAGVICHGRRLHPGFLRDKWLALGDFSRLLQPTNQRKPPSLMQGDLFRDEVQSAFRSVLGMPANDDELEGADLCSAAGVEPAEVFLDVQTTNVAGTQRAFVDAWGQTLFADEFRAPMRFRNPEDYRWETLATAARASASFPAAFAPFPVADEQSADPAYVGRTSAELAGFAGKTRFAIDGGLLENAPIRPAIELIPSRPAERSVTRFVCYVNASPPSARKVSEPPVEPSFAAVLGYVVNLPRDGRFVDQLVAIEDATRRGITASDTATALLTLDESALRATACALLPAYRRRRALLSLEEITSAPDDPPDSGIARRIYRLIEADPRLPWIPTDIAAPQDAADWRWGFRTAERVLFLQLDILRKARLDGDAPEEIVALRKPIDAELANLRTLSAAFYAKKSIREATRELLPPSDLEAQLRALDCDTADSREKIVASLERGTRAFYDVLAGVASGASQKPHLSTDLLFGQPSADPFGADAFGAFLQRALYVEVIRRSFAADQDVDSAQSLHFAQLTPLAPCPILTSRPFTVPGPSTPEQKLTGIRLGHFAAFYRRSWRVNDYMWGRLDAAARIADLFVGAQRAGVLRRRGGPDPAGVLAQALVPAGDDDVSVDLRRLVREALDDAATAKALPQAIRDAARRAAALGGLLPGHLEPVLAADLADEAEGGLFTRVVCARAAQYEVLREELPILASESASDGKLGCFTGPLTFDTSGSFKEPLADLRSSAQPGFSLPERLGRDLGDEGTSQLALRTVSHAALVAIAMLATLGLPMARLFAPARVPFLAVSGVTTTGILRRLVVCLVFAGAAAFLTARLVTAEATAEIPLGALWSPAVLATWLAALAVLSVVLVPAWRAVRSESPWRQLGQALWAVFLAGSGGAVAVGLAVWKLGGADTLTAWGGEEPPGWILVVVFSALLGTALVLRRLPIPAFVTAPIVGRLERADVNGAVTAALAAVAAACLGGWSVLLLWDHLDDGGWRTVSIVCAGLSLPVVLAYVLFVRFRRKAAAAMAQREQDDAG